MHVLERRIGRPILLSLTNMIPVLQDEKLQMKRKHEISRIAWSEEIL